MTRDEWSKLSSGEKAKLWRTFSHEQRKHLADLSYLTPQLNGLEGQRVEAVRKNGVETVRFYVGRSSGWSPIHLEVKLMTSTGGNAADREYKSITVLPGKRRI
jgi:hypothetical protein